jgi:hypothetical protein
VKKQSMAQFVTLAAELQILNYQDYGQDWKETE